MDIVVSRNGQLQWSIIGSDMPSALGLVANDSNSNKASSEMKVAPRPLIKIGTLID